MEVIKHMYLPNCPQTATTHRQLVTVNHIVLTYTICTIIQGLVSFLAWTLKANNSTTALLRVSAPNGVQAYLVHSTVVETTTTFINICAFNEASTVKSNSAIYS